MVEVAGSRGILVADPETGNVTDRHPHSGVYSDIVRLDVKEWERTYPGESAAAGIHDILDFGYWLDDGTYVKASEDFRQEWGDENHE